MIIIMIVMMLGITDDDYYYCHMQFVGAMIIVSQSAAGSHGVRVTLGGCGGPGVRISPTRSGQTQGIAFSMTTPAPNLSGSTQANAQRNLDGFFSFLGITAAIVPVLLCVAYATRRRREDIQMPSSVDGEMALRPSAVLRLHGILVIDLITFLNVRFQLFHICSLLNPCFECQNICTKEKIHHNRQPPCYQSKTWTTVKIVQ
jgi:hypothetical protein